MIVSQRFSAVWRGLFANPAVDRTENGAAIQLPPLNINAIVLQLLCTTLRMYCTDRSMVPEINVSSVPCKEYVSLLIF